MSARNSLGCNWQCFHNWLNNFLQCWNLTEIKALKRKDCYSSAAMPRRSPARLLSSTRRVSWIGLFEGFLLRFFSSSAVLIDHTSAAFCSFVFDEYLFAQDKWGRHITAASLVLLSLPYSLCQVTRQLVWLFRFFDGTSVQCRSSRIYKTNRSLGGFGKSRRSLKRVPEK